MNSLSDYESQEDLALNGYKDIKKFVKANYRFLAVHQMVKMLGVTPSVIEEILTPKQLQHTGVRSAPSVLIVRDMDSFKKDYDDFKGT